MLQNGLYEKKDPKMTSTTSLHKKKEQFTFL